MKIFGFAKELILPNIGLKTNNPKIETETIIIKIVLN